MVGNLVVTVSASGKLLRILTVLPAHRDAGHRVLDSQSVLITTLRYNALVRDPRATATLTGTMVSRPAGPSFIAQLHEIDDEVERTRRAPPAVNKTLAGAHSFLEKMAARWQHLLYPWWMSLS